MVGVLIVVVAVLCKSSILLEHADDSGNSSVGQLQKDNTSDENENSARYSNRLKSGTASIDTYFLFA